MTIRANLLWSYLCQVKSLRFVAQSESPTGWNGAGSGEVEVEMIGDTACLFWESGIWQPNNQRSLHFTNVYRWTLLTTESVRLEHLRFGAEHPVHLFDLMPSASGTWTPGDPHLFLDDCYTAELQLRECAMVMRWSIMGPKKKESIEYEYSL